MRVNHRAGADRVEGGSIAADCRHYLGDRPCIHNRLCNGCPHYHPYQSRIVVIKLGALGDVIRTLSLIPGLRRRHPEAHITWVTLPNAHRMLSEHTGIDRLLTFDGITALRLAQENFDLAINLDKEAEPCALMNSLQADTKLGIGLSPHGTPVPINPQAHHYFHLGLCDDLKFQHNRKTYQHLIYEALGLTYRGERYELDLPDDAITHAQTYLRARGWYPDLPTIGINTGAGGVFANKMWTPDDIAALIKQIELAIPSAQIVLLGGPGERPGIDRIKGLLERHGLSNLTIDSGTDHDELTFASLVDACDVIFTGDTMAMHVAIARGKGVVAWFGPTCEQEIDLFGRGEKLASQVACAPCYTRVCTQADRCLKGVSPEEATAAIMRTLKQARECKCQPKEVHLPLAA